MRTTVGVRARPGGRTIWSRSTVRLTGVRHSIHAVLPLSHGAIQAVCASPSNADEAR
jgi:hypothetical protein